MESAIYFLLLLLLLLLPLIFFLHRKRNSTSNGRPLPPGSLGIPIIGQSLELLKAMRAGRGEDWLQQRARKYGGISKLHIFGTPTVFLHGQAANRFIYASDEHTLSNKQPASVRRLLGEKNLFELCGEDHRRLRGPISSFLKPEALRQYVGKMDDEIRRHLEQHWHHGQKIAVLPLMKTLTFDVICTLVFGVERGERRDRLVRLFEEVMDGMLALPVNLPFTRFRRNLGSRAEAGAIIRELMDEKRADMDGQDLITCLLSMRNDHGAPLLSDQEIEDNCVVTMIAGHETTSTLLTIMVKLLAEHPRVYETVLKEQQEIAVDGEVLTWEDLAKMKYTWRFATEALRMYPPVFASFRQVLKDIEFGEYVIPKGWQVLGLACMTQMDESIFLDPYNFNPSRYEKQGAIAPYTFVAFGGGPRMCPGNEFARIETLTMIHYLVTRFDWKLCLEKNILSRNPMPSFNQGLPIQIRIKKPT